jgi:hypothetical protein
MEETGLKWNEMYGLLASTGNKIQHAVDQPDQNLGLLVLLCNTLDRNLLILQSTACSTGYMYDNQGKGCQPANEMTSTTPTTTPTTTRISVNGMVSM